MNNWGPDIKRLTFIRSYWRKFPEEAKNHAWYVSYNLNYKLKPEKHEYKFENYTELKNAILKQLETFGYENVTDKLPEGISVTYYR